MTNPQLQTTRLWLQPCRMEDLEAVYKLWTDQHVRHFLFDDKVISVDEARSFVEASLENFAKHQYGIWLVFARGDKSLIGFAGFLRLAEDVPNLIYGIHPDFCGKGYATEAAAAVLSYALDNLALPLVKADVDEPNVLSIRVLEKLGMVETGRTIVAGRPLVNYEKACEQDAGPKHSTMSKVILLMLTGVLMTVVACKEAGDLYDRFDLPNCPRPHY